MKNIVVLVLVIAVLVGVTTCFVVNHKKEVEPPIIKTKLETPITTDKEVIDSDEEVSEEPVKEVSQNPVEETKSTITNGLSDFDLSFLKFENKEDNLIYSPLSIKYALKMLEEGANGETKAQISKLIGDYTPTQYVSNANMSLANGLFIKDSHKDDIKQSYIDLLKSKYDAEVKFDDFSNAENLNNWISEKTLKIIPQMLQDDDVAELNFALVNALAIDMEWVQKFTQNRGQQTYPSTEYAHEKGIDVYDIPLLKKNDFNNQSKQYSTMGIEEVINNYDIVKELGEDEIKRIVSEDYKKFLNLIPGEAEGVGGFPLGEKAEEDYTEEDADKDLEEFLPRFIEEINENYHKMGNTTDFGVYVDDEVKVFQKELKKYGDTTLEYYGIMPIKENLSNFVKGLDSSKIKTIFSNIKKNAEDFEDGVVTRIRGTIPKFKFEYDLELMKDLQTLGITDVFDSHTSDLTNLSEVEGTYIDKAKHKANIEFTQDGIKAAAATFLGGAGGGSPYDYFFEVPVKEIDLTFDKPYLFIIRDKDNGEVWFVGTVYEPLLWDEDTTKGDAENIF